MNSKNEYTLSDVLKELFNQYQLNDGLLETDIKKIWEQMMGSSISKNTLNLRFQAGKLFITLTSDALKHELHFSKQKIRKKMNEHLKNNPIQEVIIM